MKIFKILVVSIAFLLVSCDSDTPAVHTSLAGTWRCMETNNSMVSQTSYLVDIYPAKADTSQYIIANFDRSGDNQFIRVKLDNGKLILAQQGLISKNIKSFNARVISLKNIQLDYTIYDGIRDNAISASYSRK